MDYKEAGVDVERGYKAVELMKRYVKRTYDKNVMFDLGSFGGFYSIENEGLKNPVLVAGTDGVGTKLKYAFITGKHDTVGIDCVAMCANDVVCQGAKPLFFLDYYAVGRLYPEVAAEVVKGVSEGCLQAGCALIGGETAEMPGFYPVGEYDLAGFCVGIVDRNSIIDGKDIVAGDVLIGLASSGVHSNGFSLIRKLFGEDKAELDKPFGDTTLGDALLTPTRIYVKTLLELNKRFRIKGAAHITGGGFIENVPRIFPAGIGCEIDLKSYPLSPLFEEIKRRSGLPDNKLCNTFNMGIGMVLCVAEKDARAVVEAAEQLGEKAYIIGKNTDKEGVAL